MSGGGFTPGLKTESLGVNEDWSWLASEHGLIPKRGGATFDAALQAADGDGNKLLLAGTAVAIVTIGGKWADYDDIETNGQEDGVGILMHDINLKDGDVVAAVALAGSPLEVRCTGVDAAFKVDTGAAFIWQ